MFEKTIKDTVNEDGTITRVSTTIVPMGTDVLTTTITQEILQKEIDNKTAQIAELQTDVSAATTTMSSVKDTLSKKIITP